MKKYIYRFLFSIGVLFFFTEIFLFLFLSPQDYERYANSKLYQAVFLIIGYSWLFYVYATLHACVNIISHKRKPIFLWLLLVFGVPALGSYIYFEKYILKAKSPPEGEGLPSGEELALSDTRKDAGWQRFVAVIIDFVIVLVLIGIYTLSFGVQSTTGTYQVRGLEALLLFETLWLFYFPLCEFFFGGTIGKRILGLEVIMQNGRKVTLEATLKRHLLDIIDLMLVAWIVPFPKRNPTPPRRMGDRWAKTKVVLRQKEALV